MTSSADVAAEFAGPVLGDARLDKRLIRIVEKLVKRPDLSFPQVMPEPELEGFYRFVASDRVNFDAVLAPHVRATVNRMQAQPATLVVHDTTEFKFTTQRTDLGRLRKAGENAKKGFLAHFALALSADGTRDPLGVVGAWPWLRTGITPSSQRRDGKPYDAAADSEQARWWRGVSEVQARLTDPQSVVHLMDSEADDYALLAKLGKDSCRFVIRQCYDRRIEEHPASGTHGKMRAFIETANSVETRSVTVAPRRALTRTTDRRRNVARKGREVTLCFSAAPMTLCRPASALPELPRTVAVNVVRVWEDSPPEDSEPIEWLLLTTEPIATVAEITRVVDLYRTRWVIEEFFKAIKTGCAFEKRQLESFGTLASALAIFVPIAWFLLRLRSCARSQPSSPATTIVDDVKLEVLRRASNGRLPSAPTVRDVLLAVARLGGHLKRNGEPGWQTIGRGYEDLLMLEAGFRLAMRCDQS